MTILTKPQHGIIILEPYASMIMEGSKHLEYRRKHLPKHYTNVPLFLLCKGRIYGIIKFVKELTELHFRDHFAWEIEVIDNWVDRPKYNHPNGAQVWVRNVNILQTKLVI